MFFYGYCITVFWPITRVTAQPSYAFSDKLDRIMLASSLAIFG
jgi:hypothetical protein